MTDTRNKLTSLYWSWFILWIADQATSFRLHSDNHYNQQYLWLCYTIRGITPRFRTNYLKFVLEVMYRLARKRRLLSCSVVQNSAAVLVSSPSTPAISPPQYLTSSHSVMSTLHSMMPRRGLHSTSVQRNIFERMAGVDTFQYDVIIPDTDNKPEVMNNDTQYNMLYNWNGLVCGLYKLTVKLVHNDRFHRVV
jgi:hypothetical protein